MTIFLLDWIHGQAMNQTYHWLRICAFLVDVVAFWILCYKFTWNNFTGRDHQLNWLACGIWAGTFAVGIGLGEILFTDSNLDGGVRLFIMPFLAFFWLYLAIWKVPIERDIKETPFERDVREIEAE